jgi:L-alanine-DL-glutamate epimerase-like enolase superfamily enzyme
MGYYAPVGNLLPAAGRDWRCIGVKITKVEHWTENMDLVRPYRIAGRTINDVENHFVRLKAGSGLYGYGAASPGGSVTGEELSDCAAALDEYLEPCLLGGDLRGLPALLRRLQKALPTTPAALAAADMALHDLAAKSLGMPLVELLGRCHQSLPTSITIGIKSLEEAKADCGEYLAQGFKILKVKIGDCLEEDIELLRGLRDFAGPDIGIRVDANQGYTAEEMLRFHSQTQALNLELIEQPLEKYQVDEMRGLPEDIRRKCAADESLRGPAQALECACPPHPFGIYNIKLMKCGGVDTARQIAGIAELAGIDLMWGCNDESCVSIAAALHVALASPTTRYLDLDGSLDLGRDLFQGGFVIENGELSTNGLPGLGVTPLELD